jgi:methylphosphotriester-DNA--protein-cysteine methyltransferase
MVYQKFGPAENLTPFVECYFGWESNEPLEKELVVESPPNGYCSIAINYGDPYFLQNKKYEKLVVPPQFVAGLSIYTYKLTLRGNIGIAGIVFKPSALSTLFGLNAFELTEERIDLFSILPQDYVQKYVAQIRQAAKLNERVKLLEELLLQHIRLNKPEPDYIDTAANLIVEKNGMLHVYDLLKDSCMSRRTFERKFLQKVGLSPKYYARIRRIGYLCNLVAGKKKVNWPEVFYEAEFYDQAHFIKDFEEFTGRTPQQYLRENSELANLVEKPRIQNLP